MPSDRDRNCGEMSMNEILLELRNVSFTYEGETEASLQNINLQIKKGKKIAVMGANGSGKSTLFLCCNGIHRPDKGGVYFHGEPVDYSRKGLLELRRSVGIVFQDPDNQLFSASVYQEISFGACNIGMSEEEAKEAVEEVMEHLEITPFRERPTHALSGGQKKQVSIADILVMKPEVIIMDEPGASLDPRHTRMVNRIMDRMTEEGITVLLATHDMDYAYAWADEIVLMHQGRILKQGTPLQVCSDREALYKTNLEPPMVLRMYEMLCHKGILKEGKYPPKSMDILLKQMEEEDGDEERDSDGQLRDQSPGYAG